MSRKVLPGTDAWRQLHGGDYDSEPEKDEIVPPRRWRPNRKRRYIPHHPWRLVVEYADGRRIRWDEGVWSGDPAGVALLQARVASGKLVAGPVPSHFPPDHAQSAKIILWEVLGEWTKTVEDKMPEMSSLDDPPGMIY